MADITLKGTGWKKLDLILDTLIHAINDRTILQGDGISVTAIPNSGCIIALQIGPSGSAKGGTSGTGGPTDGQWMVVTIVDPGSCQQSQIQVWAKPV